MTSWLARFLSRTPGFEQEVVERFTQRLLRLARAKLPQRVRQRVDPEDIVQSVYRSFFKRLKQGQFAFEESHDVWRLLAAMTYNKVCNARKFHERQRRDVRREQPLGESQLPGEVADAAALEKPQAEDVQILYDSLQRLLQALPDNYRTIAVLRLEGNSIEQIAQQVKRSRRTVLRVLAHLQEVAARQLETRT
jgi:RNA polymerase sigma-70 factor (ECF subfamily)